MSFASTAGKFLQWDTLFVFLLLSAFISISAFQILVALSLITLLVVSFRDKHRPAGILFSPLVLISIPTFLSTAIFNTNYLKSVNQSIYSFLYLEKDYVCADNIQFRLINTILIAMGLVTIPVIAYKYIALKRNSPFWGGEFEIGHFYRLFTLAALSLFFYTKKKSYLVLGLLYSAVVFFSTKRSSVLGLIVAVGLLLFFGRRYIERRVLVAILACFLITSSIFVYVCVQKDPRFGTAYNLLSGKEKISDDTLNTITSLRWTLFQEGVRIISHDIEKGNVVNLLIGHGIKYYKKLGLKYTYSAYESVFVISELIERGVIGLGGIIFFYWRYFSFVFRFRVQGREDFLLLSCLLFPSAHFGGMIFTDFWDAIVPLYLLLFGMVENHVLQRQKTSQSVS